jgi:acyl dehydratase
MSGPQITEGAVVKPLERTIELPDMIAYAGSTWDWHRLHYDPTYLAAKQLPAPVIDGQVFGAHFVETLQDWLGPRAFVTALSFRFKNLVFAGETIRVTGTVTSITRDEAWTDDEPVYLLSVDMSLDVVGEKARPAVNPASATVRWRP